MSALSAMVCVSSSSRPTFPRNASAEKARHSQIPIPLLFVALLCFAGAVFPATPALAGNDQNEAPAGVHRNVPLDSVREVAATQAYRNISSRWYGTPSPYWTVSRVLTLAGLAFLLLAAAFAVYHYLSLVKLNRALRDAIKKKEASEEEVHRQRELFEIITSSTPDHIIVQDADLRYVFVVNPQLGLTREDMIGKTDYDILPKEDADKLADVKRHVLNTGSHRYFDVSLASLEGERQFFEGSYVPRVDKAGQVTGLIGYFRNATRRKRMEDDIKALSLRNEAIFAAIPDIIMEVDENKIYTWANRAGMNFFGETVIGKEAAFYFVDEQETYNIVNPLFAGSEDVIYVESWQRRRDGEKRLLAWWCRVMKDAEGNVTGALSTARDITEDKQVEEKLRDSEAMFRSLAEQALIGMSITQDGVLKYVNAKYAEMHGYTVDELTGGFPTVQLVHPDHRARAGERSRKRAAGERVAYPHVMKKLRKNGDVFYTETYGTMASYQGRPARFGFILDITERMEAESEIRRINAQLEERVARRTAELEARTREMERFTYSVSHDLKSPLRGIDGYSRLLLEEYSDALDEEGRIFLENIRLAADQMDRLIEDLLAYSRMERRTLDARKVDVRGLVLTLLNEREEEIEKRGIKLDLHVPSTELTVDPEGLSQALRNLLDNALKYTRGMADPRIEIAGEEREGVYLLRVRDNGVGFDMVYHDRIFQIFQRLQNEDDYTGTGIGLAIVQKCMERMKGSAWAESSPGHGATFYLGLPL